MGNKTQISWADSTFNPWIGCTKVSPACDHCYAAVSKPSRTLGVVWGAGNPRHRTGLANWKLPLRWNAADFRACGDCGWRGEVDTLISDTCPGCGKHEKLDAARRRVFCASLSDWLDNEVPAELLADVLDLVRRTPNLDWLLLTKRIGNWHSQLKAALATISSCGESIAQRDWIGNWLHDIPPPNVWLGATICNQAEADRDVPKLLRVPAAVRFVSIEPMLGTVDLKSLDLGELYWLNAFEGKETIYHDGGMPTKGPFGQLHWVIAGGESGSHARPSHPDWFRALRDQCAAARVPFLFKQWGEHAMIYDRDRDDPDWRRCAEWDRKPGRWINLAGGHGFHGERVHYAYRVGKKAAGRTLDGKTHHEFPGENAHVG